MNLLPFWGRVKPNQSDNDSMVGMCEDSLLDIFLLLFLHRFDFLQQEAVNGRHQTGIVVA